MSKKYYKSASEIEKSIKEIKRKVLLKRTRLNSNFI
ncbi:MAG: hypothetical protein PWQ77_1448 [Kosmotogales bacterium]|nr:hypothetical protein [Kosmotogales bacterium]